MSEKRSSNIPSLKDLSKEAHRRRVDRQQLATRAGHLATSAEGSSRDIKDEEQQRVASKLRTYAKAVSEKLAQKSYPPEVRIEPFRIRIGQRFLTAGKAKTRTDKLKDGWILTPPIDIRSNRRPSREAPFSNSNALRKGFALGADGEIYTYSTTQPLKSSVEENPSAIRRHTHTALYSVPPDPEKKPMIVRSNLDERQIVRPDQIICKDDTYVYNDNLLGPDLNLHDLPAELSPDDLSLIHGSGILEALGDLYDLAEST